ncbi:MAG: hypothetical protein AB7S71_00120 [Dongiaceae bacterium]
MGNHAIAVASTGRWARVRAFLLHEFREMLPPTIFFFVGFNLILFSKRLLLADYLIQFSGFMLATTSALVVGKTVLVANMMPFLRRFDHAPLVQPVLFKTVVYTLLVFVVRLLEALIHYLIQSGILGGGGFLHQLLGSFRWDHFIVVQMWIFLLFLIYVTASELDDMLGDGELFKIFFTRRSSELKSTRRARIRLLVQLSRLTDAHPIDLLSDPKTPQHAQLVAILRNLGRAR